jgi:AraC-like DNA-binding protein
VLPRGRPLRDLADRVVSLPFPLPAELIELSELLASPMGADGTGRGVEAELLDRVERALRPWLVPTGARDQARSDLTAAAIRLLSSGHESGEPASGRAPVGARVAAIAQRLHVSERQLRNVFDRAVGVSPKQFAQVGRVRSVLVHAPQEGLARAASHAGYYDQAHMTAEFRRVMGVPPGAFLAGARPAPTACGRRA